MQRSPAWGKESKRKEKKEPESQMKPSGALLTAVLGCCVALSAWLYAFPSVAANVTFIPGNKSFDDLTPAEKTAAKALARTKKLPALRVCADPGNMPLSDTNGEGYENKIMEVLAKAMDTKLEYFWRPYQERGLTTQTFDSGLCDVLLDVPTDFERILATTPIYRTTYVFAYRTDSGISIETLDDPKLKTLRVGVFQQSGLRQALAVHGVIDNLKIHVISYDADLEPENQPWHQVQDVVDGKLDVAGVWGPFAGYLVKQGAPLTLVPVNRMEDQIQLEFDLALGVRRTDVVLKYMLDNALEKSKDEIAKILADYHVPLVQCSRCIVSGDIPAHGSYSTHQNERARDIYLKPIPEERTKIDASKASPDQVVTEARVEDWLKDGSSLTSELSNAVVSSDRGRVTFLLSKRADVNALNDQGLAPLHTAARSRDSDMIAFLLSHGADPNLRDADGWTPLLHAAFRNHVPSIQTLAAAGADLDASAPGGFTALVIALSEGKFFAAKALLDAGAQVNTVSGEEQLTPLMVIASQPLVERRSANIVQGPSSVDIGRILIAKGADVNAKSGKGVTPLMIAAAHDNPPLIGLLLQSGADANAKTPDGKTALDIAKDNLNEAATQQIEILTKVGVKQGALSPPPSASDQADESAAGQ
jgi:quinoprotein dehydrogenase-associated probable ABC transporter substrate-binding protein